MGGILPLLAVIELPGASLHVIPAVGGVVVEPHPVATLPQVNVDPTRVVTSHVTEAQSVFLGSILVWYVVKPVHVAISVFPINPRFSAGGDGLVFGHASVGFHIAVFQVAGF